MAELVDARDSKSRGVIHGSSILPPGTNLSGAKIIRVATGNHTIFTELARPILMRQNPKLIVILGPTASGKSELAVEIARRFNGEVVSADSRQVYSGLDIGSGKITKREMRGVPHHLLDVANPKRQFSVAQYQRLAKTSIADIAMRGKTPIICGGTGFYIQSIIDGIILPEVPPNDTLRKKLFQKNTPELFAILKKLDSRRARDIDAKNPARLIRAIEIAHALGRVPKLKTRAPYHDVLQIGITLPPDILREKIITRLTTRLRRGMIAEARHLHEKGLSWKRMKELGLEYRALADFLSKTMTRAEIEERIITESTHYAKRQMTWFRRDSRVKWFIPTEKSKIFETVEKFLKR